jgi:1-acyl-sn-glycerol-3-phosphate acyltransferase
MITLVLLIYFLPAKYIAFYIMFNYILSAWIFHEASKYYFPNMKNNGRNANSKHPQYFHEDFPSFNRIEHKSLSFFWVFHGMLNYFWIKASLSSLTLILLWIITKMRFFNKSRDREFTLDERRFIEKWFYYLVRLLYTVMGVWTIEQNLSTNKEVMNLYRKYLGPDYSNENIKYTTVISNHSSFADILYISSKTAPSFLSKETVKNYWFVGYISYALNTIYLDRTSKDNREQALKLINERIRKIQKSESFFPMALFPEGTATNGRTLINFKKGAFGENAVIKPYIIKPSYDPYPMANSAINIILHMALSFTFLKCDLYCLELPIFAPNEFLFRNFSHFGKDKTHIYSEVMKKIMSEISYLPIRNANFDTKLEYLSLIRKKEIKNT